MTEKTQGLVTERLETKLQVVEFEYVSGWSRREKGESIESSRKAGVTGSPNASNVRQGTLPGRDARSCPP